MPHFQQGDQLKVCGRTSDADHTLSNLASESPSEMFFPFPDQTQGTPYGRPTRNNTNTAGKHDQFTGFCLKISEALPFTFFCS